MLGWATARPRPFPLGGRAISMKGSHAAYRHASSSRRAEISRAVARAGIILKHDADAMNASMALEDMDRGGVTLAVNSTPAPPRAVLENAGQGLRLGAREQRLSRPAGRRSPRPLRHVHGAADAAMSICALQRDRIRARCAEGRRRLSDDHLSRSLAGRQGLRAGVRGAQPPQGADLHPSASPLLLHPAAERDHDAGCDDRIRHRHDARHRQHDLHRHGAALPAISRSSGRMPAARCRS